jgi:hypothetical protein
MADPLLGSRDVYRERVRHFVYVIFVTRRVYRARLRHIVYVTSAILFTSHSTVDSCLQQARHTAPSKGCSSRVAYTSCPFSSFLSTPPVAFLRLCPRTAAASVVLRGRSPRRRYRTTSSSSAGADISTVPRCSNSVV